jgi:homoaconitase/3-isopropylmalate dehydratase large subunit
VPRHEPGPAEAGGAVRVDEQPEFRGQAGQRVGGRTCSAPAMAAAAAISGRLTDVRKMADTSLQASS